MIENALDIAHYFLCRVDREAGDTISPLKLQKLLYYAQAWSLVFRKQPIFLQDIEAWVSELIQGLKKIEAYTWGQRKGHGSKKRGESVATGYKLISNHPNLPEDIPEDAKLSEMRIDEKKLII